MTLQQAQDQATASLVTAFQERNPRVYVESYDGVFSFEEASKRSTATPKILVSPLSVDPQDVKLAVYTLFRVSDKDQLEVLDMTATALRNMAGEGRPILNVSARTLYDKDALKGSMRLWVHMVEWPHLATGDDPGSDGGPIWQEKIRIKTLLLGSISSLLPIGTKADAITRMLLSSDLPFVTIASGSGSFEVSDARTIKYEADNKLFTRTVRGSVNYPITVKAYAHSEAEAENLLWPVLPLLPQVVMLEGLNRTTVIQEMHSGETENGASVASVTVMLKVPVATPSIRVATFKNAVVTTVNRRI